MLTLDTINEQIDAAELDLIGAILADHRRGIVIAESLGVAPHHFAQPDLRILFCAADLGRHLDKAGVLKLARRALREADLWDPQQIAGNAGHTMRHSDATLCAIACSWPAGIVGVRPCAERLFDLLERRQRAVELLNLANAALEAA